MSAARDTGLKTVSTVVACSINGLIFTGMAMAGLIDVEPPPPDLPAVDVELVQMIPKLGSKPPEPEALPRIVQPTPPPPPTDDEISLSREKEEQLERERQQKEQERIEAERRKQEEEEQRREDEARRRREEDRRRRKAMQEALDRAVDPRADDEDAPGFEEGSAVGNSLDPNSLRNKQLYIARLMVALKSQFEVPSVIPDDVRKRLKATVSFKINAGGKVVGEPRLVRSSGNKFFDDAALNTVRKFGPGSALRIPLPTDPELKKSVLRQGLQPDMYGKDL